MVGISDIKLKEVDRDNVTSEVLTRIDVLLCRPRYGGNIGSTARVVKNMGLGGLTLILPDDYMESEARMMAASAQDVLSAAGRAETLEEGLDGYGIVLGVSRRPKSSRLRIMTPREAAKYLARETGPDRAALLFGPEDSGLASEELSKCQGIISIPANENYPSLNLAQAVMIVAYELRMMLDNEYLSVRSFGEATEDERSKMILQIVSVLERTGFFIRNPKDRAMLHVAQILAEGVNTSQDARIMRGIFRRIAWALENSSDKNDTGEI